ncbi:MAG: sugar ABC transporter substrate-binding protein [Bifidobacteriaceae bacterium]|nr:sugar ABC transporter substrate-binding protein [Bifidobacteriaceae bacterium]
MKTTLGGRSRHAAAAALFAVVAIGVTACSSDTAEGGDSGAKASCERTYTIAFSHPTGEVAAVKAVKSAVEERAEANGCVNLLLDNTVDSNLETQRRALESWVTQKVDAIVVWPVDAAAVEGIREQAQAQGIKWLTYASSIPEEDGAVGFDNEIAGQEMAELLKSWIEENYPDKNIKAAVTTATALPSISGRSDYPLAMLDELGIEVVSQQDCVAQDCGLQIAEDVLRQYPDDLKIFVGMNDDAGTGALRALLNAGVDMDGFFVAGYDGTEEALISLRDDAGYTASSAIPLRELGYSIIDNSIAAITGEGDPSSLTPMTLLTAEDKDQINDLLALFE